VSPFAGGFRDRRLVDAPFPPTLYLGSVARLVIEIAIIRPSWLVNAARQRGSTPSLLDIGVKPTPTAQFSRPPLDLTPPRPPERCTA
jgi:hypothetical protein